MLDRRTYEPRETGPDYPLCRLYHGRGPRRHGAPINCQNFYHAVLTFERASLNIATTATTKNGRQLFGSRKVHP